MPVKTKDVAQLSKWSQSISNIRNNLGTNYAGSPLALTFIAFALRAMDTLLLGTTQNPSTLPVNLIPNSNSCYGYSLWAGGLYNDSADFLSITSRPEAPRLFTLIAFPYSKIKLTKDVTEFEFSQFSNITCLSLPVVAPPTPPVVVVPPNPPVVIPPIVLTPPVFPAGTVTLATLTDRKSVV